MRLPQQIIFHITATAVALWAIQSQLFPETFHINGDFIKYPFVAFVFGGMNALLKPILTLLTFPIHFISLGLSSIFLNGFILWLWTHVINLLEINGIEVLVDNFLTYLLVGICLAILNVILHWFEK